MSKYNQTATPVDLKMMRRALQLADGGGSRVSPNPLVGAVVAVGDRILGEGFHRRWGGPHAEVNAVNSVKEEDRGLLKDATIYVTLEPCSHYGKTPPCAKLIIDTGIPRVVVGAPDPNPLVSGRGIGMLRDAGLEVVENILLEECLEQNRRFMTAQKLHRPWIQLKWAQTADGYIGQLNPEGEPMPLTISNDITLGLMHQERSMADAILVGSKTIISDNPALTLRMRPGKNPLKVSFLSDNIPSDSKFFTRGEYILLPVNLSLEAQMKWLREKTGINSLMVEGGRETLQRFIDASLFDEIRIETSPRISGVSGVPAPTLHPADIRLLRSETIDSHRIDIYRKSDE